MNRQQRPWNTLKRLNKQRRPMLRFIAGNSLGEPFAWESQIAQCDTSPHSGMNEGPRISRIFLDAEKNDAHRNRHLGPELAMPSQPEPKRQDVQYESKMIGYDFDRSCRLIREAVHSTEVRRTNYPYPSTRRSNPPSSFTGGATAYYWDCDAALPFPVRDPRWTLIRVSTENGELIAECFPIRGWDFSPRTEGSSDGREKSPTTDDLMCHVRWKGEHFGWPPTMIVRYFEGDNLLDIQTVSLPPSPPAP